MNDNKNQLKISPSSQSDSPKLIGLNKVGGIPYMNAILQCLIQNKSLTDSFLEESDKIRNYDEDESKDEYEYELSQSYLTLIERLWKINKNTNYNPYNFKNVVLSYDKSFDKSNSEKIKDFIDFIIEQLHQELKKKKINDIKLKQNDSDKEIIYKNFLAKFEIEKSIISDEIFGIVETSYKCLECNNNITYYSYEILKYIIFNLEEIENAINSINNSNQNNRITIDDCFHTIYDNNTFIREKNYFCYNCNQLTRCKYYMKLLKLPNTLIIILNRNINKMNHIELDFYNEIKILQKEYENNNTPKISYELYGVVTCINQTELTEQHFVAFCKSSINNKWYKYDDNEVSDSINDIQKDILKYKIPFVLFYKKKI
jgi:ubiquitin C-terminal hydrolase